MNMQEKRIDIEKILVNKAPRLSKWIPNFAVSYLKKIVHQDELNDIIHRANKLEGKEFTSFLINELNISFSIIGAEKLETTTHTTFISNHPLGGMDGIILLDMLNNKCGETIAPVNDLLMHIDKMKTLFIPINIFGIQTKENATQLSKIMQSETNVLFFPAGKVSRRQANGEIKDEAWHKTFVSKSREYNRNIVPIFFDGECSKFFYNLAYYRTKIGLPNIEMLYLADEMFKCRGKHFNIYIGDKISHENLKGKSDKEWTQTIFNKVYNLKSK